MHLCCIKGVQQPAACSAGACQTQPVAQPTLAYLSSGAGCPEHGRPVQRAALPFRCRELRRRQRHPVIALLLRQGHELGRREGGAWTVRGWVALSRAPNVTLGSQSPADL